MTDPAAVSLIDLNMRIRERWSEATALAAHRAAPPTVVAVSFTEVGVLISERIALVTRLLTPELALADTVKFWALQRACNLDETDRDNARTLAGWWGKQPRRP